MTKAFIPALLLYALSANAQAAFNSYDINPGGNSNPSNFIVGNKLFFIADDGSKGREPHVTLLTILAPFRAADINTTGDCGCSYMVYNNSAVYFKATDGGLNNGDELYKTDLSVPASTTSLLKDIYPGTTGSDIRDLCLSNGNIYFQAFESNNWKELWYTDGTNTALVNDLNPGQANGNPLGMTNFNNKVYFSAFANVNTGRELYQAPSSGTINLVSNIVAAANQSSNPTKFKAVGANKLFFLTEAGFGNKLAVMDNLENVTVLPTLTSVPNMGGVENLNEWGELNGNVFFKANDGTLGEELWKSDGTVSGTVRVKDINPTGSSEPGGFYTFLGNLYFSADDGTNGRELWVTDGTEAGTKMYKDINTTGSSNPSLMVENNNRLYFKAQQSTGDYQLFELEPGLSTQIKIIAPSGATKINPLGNTTQIASAISQKRIYFGADYDAKGQELWTVSNPANVSVAQNIAPQTCNLYPNPTDGNFRIELNNTNFKNGSITVFDMMGREIYQSTINHQSSLINLKNPAKGIYIIKLELDDAVHTKRLIVN